MEPKALSRLTRVAGKQTTTLTHYGRKTGKPHEVTIWFVLDDDKLYIGTRCSGLTCPIALPACFPKFIVQF